MKITLEPKGNPEPEKGKESAEKVNQMWEEIRNFYQTNTGKNVNNQNS